MGPVTFGALCQIPDNAVSSIRKRWIVRWPAKASAAHQASKWDGYWAKGRNSNATLFDERLHRRGARHGAAQLLELCDR
jgi:hypothetical protein